MLPKLVEIFWRNKGTPDKVKFVKIGNPLGILFIRFFTSDSFDIFGMCKAHLDIMFKIIKNRNPIRSCGFYTNMITMIFNKPIMKFLDIQIDGWKRFLVIIGYSVKIGCYDCCNYNFFVDIKFIADGVFLLHQEYHHLKKGIAALMVILWLNKHSLLPMIRIQVQSSTCLCLRGWRHI